jgi:hypothetical protein
VVAHGYDYTSAVQKWMTKEKLANRWLAAVERHEAKPFHRFWRH